MPPAAPRQRRRPALARSWWPRARTRWTTRCTRCCSRAAYRARRRIALVTPYFVPDAALLMALCLAARRGVQVELLMPARSNHRLSDMARGRALRALAQAGGAHLAGAADAACQAGGDRRRAGAAGSANLDSRSLFLNYELMLAFHDAEAVRPVRTGSNVNASRPRYLPARKPGCRATWPTAWCCGWDFSFRTPFGCRAGPRRAGRRMDDRPVCVLPRMAAGSKRRWIGSIAERGAARVAGSRLDRGQQAHGVPPNSRAAGQQRRTMPARWRWERGWANSRSCGSASGFGVVYLATDHALALVVAIKEYLPATLAAHDALGQVRWRSAFDGDAFERGRLAFIDEARILARCEHPSLLRVHRVWAANGTVYRPCPTTRART